MTKRGLLLWAVTVLLLTTFVHPALADPNPVPPTAGKNAGRISALLPVAKITRGTGRAAVSSEAKRGDELVWNDLVKTEKGGRARITLADQSIVSLGSQSELRIVKHDARAQQTTLQMAYGRVRAQVASITRDRGSFELRTPTAVAGVIGTDFGVDSSAVGGDTFVCLAGAVQVSNADPNVAGSVQCNAGQTTTVSPGKSPTTPKPATLQQLQQLIEDTEPSIIASISPAAALPGTNFDSTIAGAKMGKVKSVSVAGGSGVNATIKSSNDTSVVIHVVIDQTASAGPRTITLEKESGASSATVFTVLGGITGDPKKAYLETIEQLRTTGVGGLSAFLAGAQQAADQVAQQITSANQNLPKPLDLTPFANSLNQQYTGVKGDLSTSTDAITKAANEAANTFGSLYDAAYQQLLQRDPAGTPDSSFTTALTNAFTQANGVLQSAISNAQTGLTSSIQNYGQSLNQIQNTWSQSINDAFQTQQAGPLPKVNALERIVELGAEASFDSSRSAASNSSTSINNFKWVLCDKSYQPNGFGQPLPENASGCNVLPGYSSANSEFVIPTCSLQPGPYYARLEVTDSNNRTSRMDVRLTVLQPGYGSPAEALRGLADGYSTLQLSEFTKWFDRTLFQGYTSLSENVRQTLQTLSSMNINLLVSQENSTCNDATVRADWQQNYTFATDPKTVLTQKEQLTVAMKRTPGVGWLITEFRGDNGKVQGIPPAISSPDVAAPSIVVRCISPGEQCGLPGAARTATRNGIATNPNGIFAVIENVGAASLTTPLKVRFDVGGQTEDVDIPVPFAPNETKYVFSTLSFPASPNGVTLTVTVNPDHVLPEVDFQNHTRSITTSGVPDYVITSLSFQGHNSPYNLQLGETVNLVVTVSNIGGTTGSGTLQLTANCGVQAACPEPDVATIDAPPAGSSVNASFPLAIDLPVGAYPGSVSIATQIPDAIVGPAFNQSFNVVDFTLTATPFVAKGVTGRTFNLPAVTVQPSPYPLQVNVSYAGLVTGLAASANVGPDNLLGSAITGTPTAVTGGDKSITVTGTVGTVSHNANQPVVINVTGEISVKPGVTPTFIPGGPQASQSVALIVQGGFYPLTLNLTLPQGFTSAASADVGGVSTPVSIVGSLASVTLTSAATVTYTLTADNTVATGNGLNFSVNATDLGYTSPVTGAVITPAGNVSVNIPYNVTGLPDLQFGAVSLPSVLQMGNSSTLNIPVQNNGTAGAAAGWDVVATINGVTAGTATVAALPANQSTIVNLAVTVPQPDPAPVNKSYPVVITLNASSLIQESNTANNTFSSNVNLADFTLTTQAASVQGVAGRAFDFTTVDIAPAPYPITPVSVGFSALPAGITQQPGISPNGLNGARISGTPTASGSTTIDITGSLFSVTHGASSPLQVIVSPEITITQVGTTGLQTGGAAQPFTINVTGGVYPVTLKLTLPTGITTADGTLGAGFSTQTLAAPGNATWNISADVTAVTGGSLPIAVQATDPGVPTTATPAGNISFSGLYSVGGSANYVVTGVSWQNHTAPYTGAQALQFGESTVLLVTVQNQGSASPGGTITATATCNAAQCTPPLVGTIAAPAAGQSITIPLSASQIDIPVGSYTGTVDLTVDNGNPVGPQATLPFDVVDFTFTANTLAGGDQNLLIGGSGVLNFSLAVQVPQGSPFGILITPSTYPNLSFTPATQTVAGASIDFTVNVGAAQPPTGGTSDTITFTATNHGVSKAVNVPVAFFNAVLQPQNLFVNDAANPLVVPIATGGQAPSNYPTINLKMFGNYKGGDATLTIQQPGCGTFVATPFPSSVSPNITTSLPIYAAVGNLCPAGTAVVVNADIPNTRPAIKLPVYTLFVAPKGLPALSLVKATPSRDISTIPWYSGEALDWDVDVQNTGAGDSAGNEKISIYLTYNGRDTFIGSVINPTPIPKGQTTTIRVHTVGYDVFKDDPTQSGFGNVRVALAAGDPKDLSPTAQDLIFSVNLENWGLANVGDGNDDANALPIGPGSLNGTDVQLVSKFDNQFPAGFQVTLVPGAYSKPQLDAPTFSPPVLSESGTSTVTVTMPDQGTPYSGYYYAQVIAQLKDGGVVTAQRETTIHFTVSSGTNTAIIDLASDVKNIAPCPNGVCGAPPSTLQVNGPLPEPFNLTATVNGCTGTCTGSADIHFTDGYQTLTSPISQTVDLAAPNNVLNGRVKAADNPDGSINVGSATVNISVTNIQAAKPGAARTPTPQPVGDNQYIMAVNIGDIEIAASSCTGILPGDPNPSTIKINWLASNGFNIDTVNWEWQDSNHLQVVGTNPLDFGGTVAGASNISGGALSFDLHNTSDGTFGLVTYYFAVTVSNSLGSATKYFPFVFDLSQGQTQCPLGNAARGSSGLTPIRGSWGKAGLSTPVSSLRAAVAKTTATKLPDVQINATDISFSPSYPKAGDTVSLRFRLTNSGDADAKTVPIALQINGTTVVSDTFDVAAGKSTLAGLQWTNAQMPTSVNDVGVIKPAALKEKLSRNLNAPDAPGMTTALVVDPQHTVAQKTTTAKTVTLAHFRMQPGSGIRDSIGVSADQRVVLALGEGACAALRFAVGAGFCPRGDVTVTVDDLAKGTYKLESDNGVADLGFNNSNYSNANFSSQVLAQSGHNYAVKLDGGRVGILTMQAVRNPEQLSEAAKRLFRQRAVLVVKGLGSGTGAPEVGDLANRLSDAMVYFDVVYQGQ